MNSSSTSQSSGVLPEQLISMIDALRSDSIELDLEEEVTEDHPGGRSVTQATTARMRQLSRADIKVPVLGGNKLSHFRSQRGRYLSIFSICQHSLSNANY